MKLIILYLILVFNFSSFAEEQVVTPQMPDILEILIKNQSIQLKSESNLGCKNTSLGGYLALLISNGSKGDKNKLSAICSNYSEYSKGAFSVLKDQNVSNLWYCSYNSYTSDKEGKSPWQYSVQFTLDKNKNILTESSIACPGLP